MTDPSSTPPLSAPSVARIAVRSTVWTMLGNYTGQVIGFVAILLLTRLLTPETFGFFALATFWVSLLSLRNKLGLNYAAIQQTETTGDLLGTYWALDALGTLGTLVLCFLAALGLRQFGFAPEISLAIVALSIAEALTTLISPLAMVLEKELQISRLTLLGAINSLIAYGVAIVLALSGLGLWSLLTINFVVSALSIISTYWLCRQRYPRALQIRWGLNGALAKSLLRLGLPTGLSLTAVASLSTQIDNFLVGTLVGPATLGYYDRAYRIASWPTVLVTAVITRIGFLTFTKVKDDLPRLTHAVRLSLWISLVIMVPIGLTLALGAQDVVVTFYGEKWLPSAPLLRFLPVVSLTTPVIGTAFWLSVALGHTRTTAWLTFAQLATITLIASPLTLRFGVKGTLAGVVLGYGIALLLGCVYIFRQVPLSPWPIFGPAALAAIAISAIWAALSALPAWEALSPFVHLPFTALIIGGGYLGIFFALRPQENKERVRYLIRAWAIRNLETDRLKHSGG